MELEPIIKTVTRNLLASVAVIAAFGLGYEAGTRRQSTALSTYGGLPATRTTNTLDAPLAPPLDRSVLVPAPPGQSSNPARRLPKGRPHDRAKAQAQARKTFADFAKYIQNHEDRSFFSRPLDLYFMPSYFSGSPGLCKATAISVDARPDGAIHSEDRYLVVGPFISPPFAFKATQPGYAAYQNYENSIRTNCAAREANSSWFTVDALDSENAYAAWSGAQLLDSVIAVARSPGALPFKLDCETPTNAWVHFCDDPRKSLSGIDPRDLARISIEEVTFKDNCLRQTSIMTHGDAFIYDLIEIYQTMPCRHDSNRVAWSITDVTVDERAQPIH